MKLSFPVKGIHKGVAASSQPEMTSPDMLNVRPYDVLERKVRGGQRPGQKKWGTGNQILATFPIVAICSATVVS